MKSAVFAAVLLALTSSTAAAVVVFDKASGLGSVDLRDVQLAFGWELPLAQRNARNVGFSAEAQVSYQWDCAWTAGGVFQSVPRSVVLVEQLFIESSPRLGSTPNVPDGFVLSGYEEGVARRDHVGECRSVHQAATATNLRTQPVGATGLYAAFPQRSGNRVLLRTF